METGKINSAWQAAAQGWLPPLPAMIGIIAILTALWLCMRGARRAGLSPAVMYWAGVWGIAGALLGGRAMEWLIQGPPPGPGIVGDLFMNGARSTLGALSGAATAGGLYLLVRKAPFLRYADAAAPAIALGYAIARIGCFFAGDDFGAATDLAWAVRFPQGTEAFDAHWHRGLLAPDASFSLPVHPVQLYHSALGLFGFALLRRRSLLRCGARLAWALMGYGVARFLLQFLRDDHGPGLAVIDTTQWLCLLMVSIVAMIWIRSLRRDRVGFQLVRA